MALGCTVAELYERVSAAEFREWQAYFAIEPWGEERADLRIAQLTAIVAGALGDKQASVERYMPFTEFRTREMTERELKAKVAGFNRMMARNRRAHGDDRNP